MLHICFIYVASTEIDLSFLPRFTQMGTDHQLQIFAQRSRYLAFKFHLCDIHVAFCFIYVSFIQLKLEQMGTDHQLQKFARKSRYLAKHAPWQRSNLKNGRK